jgi:AraC-like DNA-binding protein
MHQTLKTEHFALTYTESAVESTLLWENHCHAQYELIAVLEGDVSIKPEGGSFTPAPMQCVIVPPLTYHAVTVNRTGTYRRVTTLFDAAAIPLPLRPYFEGTRLRVATDMGQRLLTLARLCQSENSEFYSPLAECLVAEILYATVEESENTFLAADTPLRQMLHYIDAHLSEPLTLDDLAARFACSKSTLCHDFKAKMQTSPKQYILQKRLALADRMLRDGTPPTAASTTAGFESYSHFYRMYKRQFGKNPKQKTQKVP